MADAQRDSNALVIPQCTKCLSRCKKRFRFVTREERYNLQHNEKPQLA